MRLSNMRVREGFTLAEVLITLGIIGVVAAMTMPTLMNSTQGAQYKAAFKKSLSALSQAVTLNVALDDYNFADIDNSTYKLEKMFKERMNVVRTETAATNIKDSGGQLYSARTADGDGIGSAQTIGTSNVTLFFNDGIMFTFNPTEAKECSYDETIGGSAAKRCKGLIDVNGTKAPNRIIKCDEGDGSTPDSKDCKVNSATDVYPVYFYDQTVLPATAAGKAVLYGK